jgi:hypothetical protein
MLECGQSFELYDSMQLASQPFSLTDYGEKLAVTGVRNSLSSGSEGHLTYIYDNQRLKEAYVETNPVTGE